LDNIRVKAFVSKGQQEISDVRRTEDVKYKLRSNVNENWV